MGWNGEANNINYRLLNIHYKPDGMLKASHA